jgi:FMN phosphatase YigB (HAD superfamily)
MKPIKAIICDVYRTILDVGEGPADAEERWRAMLEEMPEEPPDLSLEQVALRCRDIIARDHSEARGRGILYPEVSWPSVMIRALPALGALSHAELDSFLFHHAQLFRKLRLMPGCREVFRECAVRGILLGIASNAQAYTLRELELILSQEGLDPSIFQSDLTFWSFRHGFSKPDPYVFQILRARLQNRHIEQSETLLIGDREDNDILPAQAAGWKTWQFSNKRDWSSLAHALFESNSIFK